VPLSCHRYPPRRRLSIAILNTTPFWRYAGPLHTKSFRFADSHRAANSPDDLPESGVVAMPIRLTDSHLREPLETAQMVPPDLRHVSLSA